MEFVARDCFVVTGASAGIGKAIALDLHARGATVIAIARRTHELERLRDAASDPDRIIVAPRDLSRDLEGLPAFLCVLAARHGLLRGIVCAAGTLASAPLRTLHWPSVRSLLELNTLAALSLLSAFARDDVSRSDAAVVLLSSVSSFRGLAGVAGYSASKGALDALCRAAAAELAPSGRRVNAILPGVVETPMTDDVPNSQLAWMIAQQLITGRIQPTDVARLCAFLLSDSARVITGECIALDAGCGLSLKPALAGASDPKGVERP